MSHIRVQRGNFTADVFYGPKSHQHKSFESAKKWCEVLKEEIEKAIPGPPATLHHYPTGRKNEKPIPLEDISNV